jgi:hypothetical protein
MPNPVSSPLRFPLPALLGLLFLFLLPGCGEREDWSPLDGPWDPDHPDAEAILQAPAPDAPIDVEMAEAGERWYRVRGCLACHRLDDEDVVGPSLKGITLRREYDWYRAMVLRPDSMLLNDPIAQELLEIYRIPMPRQGVDDLRVRAMWEFHRQVDRTQVRATTRAPAGAPSP